jgi:ribosome-associated toxin RatA of RatAB toxin-antitoxin module
MVKISSSIIVKAKPERAFEVITDFANYSKFVSEITKSKVLKSSAKKATAEFEMNIIQKISYTLDFSLKPSSEVSWKFVKGDPILKDNSGSWSIEEQSGGKIKVLYEANVELNMWFPESILKNLLGENLPKMLEKFKDRMERR